MACAISVLRAPEGIVGFVIYIFNAVKNFSADFHASLTSNNENGIFRSFVSAAS